VSDHRRATDGNRRREIMPPKSTCLEPKLRSGIGVRMLDGYAKPPATYVKNNVRQMQRSSDWAGVQSSNRLCREVPA
jgi:hypothetical protein